MGPIAVDLAPEMGAARVPFERELLGVSAALLELSLTDLPEVVPRVRGTPPSPSLGDAFDLATERWTATVRLTRGADGGTRLGVRLCDSAQACADFSEVLFAEDPSSAAARVASSIAAALSRPASAEMLAGWVRPVSADRYATIVCGRGAARVMGLSPPLPQKLWGHRREDPLTRAIWIDPDLALCHWLIARRAASANQLAAARVAMERAVMLDKGRLLFWMDRAALYASPDGKRSALGSWEAAGVRGNQARFRIGRARTHLGTGDAHTAADELKGLPAGWNAGLSAILLRIQIASSGVEGEDLDSLLTRWQQLSPRDPEPVRRRIALRVRQGRHADALELADALRFVDHSGQAPALGIALAVAAKRLEEAATRARDLDNPELAALLEARRHLEGDPLHVPPALQNTRGAAAALARATVYLRAGRVDQALREAEAVQGGALFPEALALRVEALAAARRTGEEARVRELLRRHDPALAAALDGSGTATGGSGPGVHVRVSPP